MVLPSRLPPSSLKATFSSMVLPKTAPSSSGRPLALSAIEDQHARSDRPRQHGALGAGSPAQPIFGGGGDGDRFVLRQRVVGERKETAFHQGGPAVHIHRGAFAADRAAHQNRAAGHFA